MRKFILLAAVLICVKLVSAAIIINEVMYDPSGTDTGHEWIEIYNNGNAVNLTNWKFYEANVNHGLTLINGSWILTDYAVIADDATLFFSDYPNFNGTLFDSTFSLSNSGEAIALKDSGSNVIDQVNYSTAVGGGGNGKSIGIFNNAWNETIPTPGKINNVSIAASTTGQDLSLEVYLDNILTIYAYYDKLFKIVNVRPEYGRVYNITVNYTISLNTTLIKQSSFTKSEVNQYTTTDTGDFTPAIAGNYTVCGIIIRSTANDTNSQNDAACKEVKVIDTSSEPCNVSINLSAQKLFYQNAETVLYDIKLNNESFSYLIEYWIEDLFGGIVKDRYNSSNTNQRSWTPHIEEPDKVVLIKARIAFLACNDSNKTDNFAEAMVVINGTKGDMNNGPNSSISIDTIYTGTDNEVQFGDIVRARLKIYKGDSTKKQIKLYAEDGSGNDASRVQSTFNLENQFTYYDLTVPVQLVANCDLKLPDGPYNLVAEGLDLIEKKSFRISGTISSVCEPEGIGSASDGSKLSYAKSSYTMIGVPDKAVPGEEFGLKVRIFNHDDKPHDFETWGYVYRGPKSYSGEYESNKESETVGEGSYKDVLLRFTVDEGTEPGAYKLKVKIRKDSQKTTTDLTDSLNIVRGIAKSYLTIESFYSNAKKASSEINLYSLIKNSGAKDNVLVRLYSLTEERIKNLTIAEQETLKFPVKVYEGRNLFFLSLEKNGEILCVKRLVVDLNNDEIQTYTKDEDISSLASKGVVNKMLETKLSDITKAALLPYKERIVYESPAEKAKKLILPFMVLLFGIVCTVLIWRM